MSVTVSPNRYVPWYQVLESLGFDVAVTALPAKVICPFCRSVTLHIYEDSKFGGAWHYCERCKSVGDIVTLAAKAWKLEIPATIRRLATICPIPEEHLTADAISNYLQLHHGKQAAAVNLRTIAAKRLTSIEDTRQLDLIKHFNLDNGAWNRDWATRFGQLCGVVTTTEVYDNIRPTRTPSTRLGRPAIGMLATPFYNLPGRIAGYLITSKDRKQAEFRDQFIPVTNHTEIATNGSYQYIDPGLAMYDVMLAQNFSSNFGRTVFAGPLMPALRLQGIHLRDSYHPLPVVGIYSGVQEYAPGKYRRFLPYDVWRSMPHRHFVFWADTPDATVFNMAARCNGAIAWLPKPAGNPRLASQFLLQLQKLARPWQEVLERVLTDFSLRARLRILQELDLPASLLSEFRSSCSPKALAALSAADTTGKLTTCQTLGKYRVVSTDSGWVAEPGSRLICSARLIIDKILTKYDDGQTYYQGTIVHRNDTVAFLEKADVVENKTLAWMQQTLIGAGMRAMHYDLSWSSKIVHIAMNFCNPVSVKGAGRYGWNSDVGAFILPKFEIAVGGKVTNNLFHIEDVLAPGLFLQNPEHTVPQLDALTLNTVENQMFWATTAAIATNIIAPALNQSPAGIGLCGMGAAYAGHVTSRISGCIAYAPKDNKHQTIINNLLRATNAHNWPLLLELPRRWGRNHIAAWLNDTTEKNVVMEIDKTLLAALKVQTNWRFVTCDTPLTNTNVIETHGATILPSWLLDLCNRSLKLKASGQMLTAKQVLADMADWAMRLGYKPDPIKDAEQWIEDTDDTETDVARYFTQTICRLVDEGKLACTRAGFETRDFVGCSYHATDDADNGLFIPRAIVNKLLIAEGLPLLDPGLVTTALAEAGVLERELTYRNYKGWLVNSKWWESQMRMHRAVRDKILRVIG